MFSTEQPTPEAVHAPQRSETAQPLPEEQVARKSRHSGPEGPATAFLRSATTAEKAEMAATAVNLPEDVWMALATDPSPRVRWLISDNIHAPEEARVAVHLAS